MKKKGNVDEMIQDLQNGMIRGGDFGGAVSYIESKGYDFNEFLEKIGTEGSFGNMMVREGTFGASDYLKGASTAIAEAWAGKREEGEGFFDSLMKNVARNQISQQLWEMESGITEKTFSPSKTLAQTPLSLVGGLGIQKQLMKMPLFKTPTKAGIGAAGIEGMIYEAGTHPVESRLLVDAMLKTGGLSMAGGGVVAGLGIGLSKLWERMIAKSPKGVQGEAEERLFDALFDYGEDPAEIVARKKLAEKKFPGMGVETFDVSPGTRDLAELGAQSMGKGRSDLADALDARQEGQHYRLLEFLNEGLGERTDIVEAHGRHVLDASNNAKQLYKDVEGVPVDDMRILSFMQRKSWRDAYQQAAIDQAARKADGMSYIDMPGGYRKKLTPEGQPIIGPDGKEMLEWQDPPVYTIGMLDQVKQALDDSIFTSNRARSMGQQQARSSGTMGGLKKIRYDFVEQLDEFSPEYKMARDEFAGHMEMADAIEMGSKFLTTPIDLLRKQFSTIKTKGARDAFRQSARAKIEERLGKLPEGVNKAEKLRTHDMMGRFQIIFKDDASFAKAGNYFQMESQMSKSRSQLLANSRTERLRHLAEMMDASPDDVSLIQLMLQGVSNPDQLYKNVQDMMKSAPSKVRDQIVAIIMDDNRLANLSRSVPERKMKRLKKQRVLPGILAPAGGATQRGFEGLQQDH